MISDEEVISPVSEGYLGRHAGDTEVTPLPLKGALQAWKMTPLKIFLLGLSAILLDVGLLLSEKLILLMVRSYSKVMK